MQSKWEILSVYILTFIDKKLYYLVLGHCNFIFCKIFMISGLKSLQIRINF